MNSLPKFWAQWVNTVTPGKKQQKTKTTHIFDLSSGKIQNSTFSQIETKTVQQGSLLRLFWW